MIVVVVVLLLLLFFFFNDTATTEIYTLSLHDALPIFEQALAVSHVEQPQQWIEKIKRALENNSGRLEFWKLQSKTGLSQGEIGRAHV